MSGILDYFMFSAATGLYQTPSGPGRMHSGLHCTVTPKQRKSSIPAAERKRRTAKKKRAKRSRKK